MSIKRSNSPSWSDVVELFQTYGTKFVIPVYQRNYVWEVKKQVKTLLDDYYALLNNNNTHFLGIVIDYLVSGSSRNHKYYVIDGQQRLTTLFLLVCALRQRAIDESNDEIKLQLEICMNVYPGKKEYKLEPLMSDGDVFRKILDGNYKSLSDIDKNTNVALAYAYIYNFISNTVKNISIDMLYDALSRLYIVEIPLDKEDNAQQIFESINAKGCPLLSTDLIRNYILMCTDDDKKDEIFVNNWRPFEDRFTSSNELEKFFRFFVMNQTREFVNKRDVYDSFRTWFDEQRKVQSIEDIIEYVNKYASCYDFIYKKDLAHIKSEKIWKVIKDFRNIESEMPAPLMLELTKLYYDLDITDNQFIETINIINSFILRRAIVGMDTSGISRFFTTVIRTILILCNDTYSNIVDVMRFCIVDANNGKASRIPDDNELRTKLESMNAYDNALAVHCFFDKYENEKVTNPVQTMNYQIEHIMPQDGKKWLAEVGLTQEEYDRQINRLGNLTLTTKHDNPTMSNNLFEYKRVILKNTAHFRLNVDVYNESIWNKDSIDARNIALIKNLIRLYPYEESIDKVVYEEQLTRTRTLPKMDKLIEWGIINKGDEICLGRYKNSSKAILLDDENVSYDGEILKINQWITKIYGFKSGINVYKEIYPVGGVDSLESLRINYLSEHPVEAANITINVTFRDVLAIKLKAILNEVAKSGKIVNFDSKNTYIRFASRVIENKVGLNGDGSWCKNNDLIVYEIQNRIEEGVNLVLYIGPGDKELRQKWLNYSINNKTLYPKYLRLKDKWNQIFKFELSDSRSNYEDDDSYFNTVIQKLNEFFENKFDEIDQAFSNAPDNLNDEAFAVKGDVQSYVVYDEEYHLRNVKNEVLKAYNGLKELVRDFTEFEIVPTKVYIAFKNNGKNIFDVEVFKSKLRISLNIKFGKLNDSKNKCRDITNIGTHGNGDYDITISTVDDVPYVITLIKQAFDYNK